MVMAYSRLPFHLGDEAIPLNPKDISREKLSDYVDKMKTGLSDDSKKVWDKLRSDAIMQINVICQFFCRFPGAELVVNESISVPKDKRVTCINKEEIIRAAAEVEVSNECFEYYDRVMNLASALDEMRKYERTHELLERNLEEMLYYVRDPDEFCDKFIGGYFNK
ncbi:MAG: hypothetical protein J6Q22_08775 [Prevotella sp.]|nr:hypothetical protein [Prevotella sp.]